MRTIKIFNNKVLIFLLLAASLGVAGCKKFLDVNDNPNNPETASPRLLLPTVEASMGQLIGNGFQIYGGIWAQYWTQSPTASQYRSFDQYNVSNTTFDRSWLTIYHNALQNAQLIITSKVANTERFKGIAYLLKAYTFQVATDAFGDIPLSGALKSEEIGSPKYDTQKLVYDSVFNYIDKGVALLNTTNSLSQEVGTQDLIFNGDMDKWLAFANTLKLKAYLRLSGVDPSGADAGIKALYANNAAFLDEDAKVSYTSTGGNENPLYNEMVALGGTQNLGASGTVVKAFAANNDPRAFKFYDLISGRDTIVYVLQGAGSLSSNSGKRISAPSALVGGRANNPVSALAPVKFFSASESSFLQAEAVARGYAAGDVSALFIQGINQSFTAANLTSAQALAYINSAPAARLSNTSLNDRIKAIITQKYFAMCGTQGFEAWTEYRRTGYPDFLITSLSSVLREGIKPVRMLYPSSEVNSNANYPGTVPLTEPVWWDVN